MKRTFLFILVIGAALAPLAHLNSQLAQPVPVVPPPVKPTAAPAIAINIVPQIKAPIAQLKAMKAANQTMIDQQAKTLQALDELQKQAEELKIFGKRS